MVWTTSGRIEEQDLEGYLLSRWFSTPPRITEAIPSSRITAQATKWAFGFLWFFTVAVYARPEDISQPVGMLHLTFVFGLCASLSYLGALARGSVRFLWSLELRLVLLLTLWYFAGVPFALWRGGSFQVITHVWLKTLLVFFLLTQTLVTVERIRKLLWAIILSELFVTAFSIFQSSRVTWVGERMWGVNLGILGWNCLGIAAAVTIPYMMAIFLNSRSLLERLLLIAAFTTVMWMLILTASRGGFLNVVFSIVLTSILLLRNSSLGRVVMLAMILALPVGVSFAPQVFWERLGTVWDSSDTPVTTAAASAKESKDDHLAALDQSVRYTLEHPIFGLGVGNFGVASGIDTGRPEGWRSTHNTYTQISSEAGIPALMLFLGVLLTALRIAWRNMNPTTCHQRPGELNLMARATLASLLSFAFGAIFANLGYEYYFFYPVAIAVGIQHIAKFNSISVETNEAAIESPILAVN